jgi:hypothetical protein
MRHLPNALKVVSDALDIKVAAPKTRLHRPAPPNVSNQPLLATQNLATEAIGPHEPSGPSEPVSKEPSRPNAPPTVPELGGQHVKGQSRAAATAAALRGPPVAQGVLTEDGVRDMIGFFLRPILDHLGTIDERLKSFETRIAKLEHLTKMFQSDALNR